MKKGCFGQMAFAVWSFFTHGAFWVPGRLLLGGNVCALLSCPQSRRQLFLLVGHKYVIPQTLKKVLTKPELSVAYPVSYCVCGSEVLVYSCVFVILCWNCYWF